MKTISLFIFTVLLTLKSLSQVMVIQVNEVQSYVGFSKQTLDEVISNPVEYGPLEHKDCRYILDMNRNRVEFYRNGDLIDEGPIQISTKNYVSVVKIIEGDFNYGLVINSDIQNESVTLYYFYDDKVEYQLFKDFEIVKSL